MGELLIEPVWNRNAYASNHAKLVVQLLIEPVWNRNRPCKAKTLKRHSLLIEPVWNRNSFELAVTYLQNISFNRTSLE